MEIRVRYIDSDDGTVRNKILFNKNAMKDLQNLIYAGRVIDYKIDHSKKAKTPGNNYK